MHTIEPHYHWRQYYIASNDRQSPFYGRSYSEFEFTNQIYNYLIHPQWDEFGSETLYIKILYVDYDYGGAIIECIGEWNDCLHNDIGQLKDQVIDVLLEAGIKYFVLIGENVLNFHGDEDAYYEAWAEATDELDGWICFINFLPHVVSEMEDTCLQSYLYFGNHFNKINWRIHKPSVVLEFLSERIAEFEEDGQKEAYFL